jgi:hypothetical protein
VEQLGQRESFSLSLVPRCGKQLSRIQEFYMAVTI